jgi:Spy/CpxP family protein refolding chaperone
VHAEVYNVLTPEQQEKAKTLQAEREQRREQWKSERPAAPPKP